MIGQLQMVAYLVVAGAFVVGMWRLAYRFVWSMS